MSYSNSKNNKICDDDERKQNYQHYDRLDTIILVSKIHVL